MRTRRIGGSIIATIPKEAVKELGIRSGELIRSDIKKVKKDFFGRFHGLGKFSKEDELETEL